MEVDRLRAEEEMSRRFTVCRAVGNNERDLQQALGCGQLRSTDRLAVGP